MYISLSLSFVLGFSDIYLLARDLSFRLEIIFHAQNIDCPRRRENRRLTRVYSKVESRVTRAATLRTAYDLIEPRTGPTGSVGGTVKDYGRQGDPGVTPDFNFNVRVLASLRGPRILIRRRFAGNEIVPL